MTQGTVKWFSSDKGYGFLTQEGGDDVFVHHTSIQSEGFRSLEEGEQVEFESERTGKGLQAIRVFRLNPPPQQPKRGNVAPRNQDRHNH